MRVVVSSLNCRLRPTETELCQILAYGKDASNGCPRTVWFSEGLLQWIKGGVTKEANVIYTPIGDMDTVSRVSHWVRADAVLLLLDSYVDQGWLDQMKMLQEVESNRQVPVIGIVPWEYGKNRIVHVEDLPYAVRPYTVIMSSKELRMIACIQLCQILERFETVPKETANEAYDGGLQEIQIV